ncbi:hypothetical protein RB598_004664 [Gaeumannomyces tritici]
MPDRCRDVANGQKADFPGGPYGIEVFNVHYADCDTAWVMCRHNQAEISREQMIDLFGRMPVRMRQWIRLIIGMPGTARNRRGGNTYPDYGDVWLWGDAQNYPTLWVHEMAHALDYQAAPGPTRLSSSQRWLDAYNNNAAISDGYAAKDQKENFAQETVIALFDTVVPGGIGTVVPNWAVIYNQHSTVRSALGDNLVPGGRCGARKPDAGIVCMGPAAPCGQRQVGQRASPTIATAVVKVSRMPPPEGPGVLAADGERFWQ